MKKLIHLVVLVLALGLVRPGIATTVIPPSFDDLVDQSDVIFQGTATQVKSEWVGEGSERHIMTYVTFTVEDALKGNPGRTYTLRTFGGTVDGETMAVADAPKFEVGNKDILFVQNNGSQVVPLVGIMHGRFRIRQDETGRAIVATNEGEPVRSVARLGKPKGANETEPTLTPDQFKAAVSERVRQTGHSSQ
jgi:hypothetical protein